MKKPGFRFAAVIIIISIILISLAPTTLVLADNPGLNIIGALIQDNISPGQDQVNTITISSPNAIDILVEASGLGQGLDGATMPLSAQNDTSPLSARTFITNIDKTSLHLAANVAQDIHVTISVPTGTTAGERYAMVYIHQTVSQSASIVVAGYVPVIVTVPTFNPNPKGTISSVTVSNAFRGKPVSINTTFNNTGNCRISGGKNKVTIKDSSGNIVWQSDLTSIPNNSLIPNFTRLVVNTYNVGLNVGNYSAKSDITLADGTLLDTKTVNFQVILPPAIPASPLLISPGNNTTPGPIINTLLPTMLWNAVSGADSYKLIVSRYPYTASDVVFSIDQINAVSYTLPAGIIFGGEKYSWQLNATNISGTSDNSTVFYFQSPGSFAPPVITASSATNISSTGATLNGNLTSLGSSSGVAVSFEYGTTTAYGASTTPQMMTATGTFNTTVTELTPHTDYHFRVKAVGASTVSGSDMTFLTSLAPTTTTTTIPAITTPTTITTPSTTTVKSATHTTTTPTSSTITTATTSSTTTVISTMRTTTTPSSTTITTSATTPTISSLDIPDIIDTSIVIVNVDNQQTTYADAVQQADSEVSLDNISGSGVILIGKYSQEPPVNVDFSDGEINGGSGKSSIKFVDVRVAGLDTGTARVTVHYTIDEISKYRENSLCLSYFFGGAWHKCSNIVVSTQDHTVSGDIPVARLTGTVIGLGGDLTQTANGIPFIPSSDNETTDSGVNWALIVIVTGFIIIIGVVILVIERNRRKTKG